MAEANATPGPIAVTAEDVLETFGVIEQRARQGLQGDTYLSAESIGVMNPAREAAALQTLDRINRQFGRGTLRLAAESLHEGWAMRQELRSPRWTTQWDELPCVR